MAKLPALKALLWDVDGTLAETERDGHLRAFNGAFEALAVPWRWSEARYGELLRVTGGRERLLHDMQAQPQAPAGGPERAALAEAIHQKKNALYADIVANGALPLRPGVRDLIVDCAAAGLAMGIVTTTSTSNVEALLTAHFGVHWQSLFAAVVCAEEAPRKKPDPLAYRIALERLGLAPQATLAIEDSPAGVQAASRCGIPVVVTQSYYFSGLDYRGAVAVGHSLGSSRDWRPAANLGRGRVGLGQMERWHASATAAG
jgi:HAD superfamily hydrolase (TIGR01509 family)